MKTKSLALWAVCALGFVFVYTFTYFACVTFHPEWLNSNDGPKQPFLILFYPLRYISAEKPNYHALTQNNNRFVEARIDWINHGNGYLYFTWGEAQSRAILQAPIYDFKENDNVLLNIRYQLTTFDDFNSRLIPTVIDIHTHPNQTVQETGTVHSDD